MDADTMSTFGSAPSHPIDDRTYADTEMGRSCIAQFSTFLYCCNHPFSKIKGIGSSHQMLASFSSQHLESERD
jgi:hypothetical protein